MNKSRTKNIDIATENLQPEKLVPPHEIVEITDIDSKCRGVARLSNGRIVFVPYSIKDESVSVSLKVNKTNFAVAEIDKIIQKSPHRKQPVCPVYLRCGGCAIQHIDYQKQLDYKSKIIASQLKKLAGIDGAVAPCCPSPTAYNYRNKAVFRLVEKGGKLEMGFYEEGTHAVVISDYCHICSERINLAVKIIKNFLTTGNNIDYNWVAGKNITTVTIRQLDDNILVTFLVDRDFRPNVENLAAELKKHFSSFGIYLAVCAKNSKATTRLLAGNEKITGKLSGLKFEVSPEAFLQVNSNLSEILYNDAIKLAAFGSNDIVIDAYSGIGILSSLVAKKAFMVYAIEIIKAATDNAKSLAKNNNIENLRVKTGDCALIMPDVLREIRQNYKNKNVTVILDPPRKGCSPEVIASLLDCCPCKIIYISCDSATLSRDLKLLSSKYNLVCVRPYDMFPQTSDIEALAYLEKLSL